MRDIGDQPSTTILRWRYERDCATSTCAIRWFSMGRTNRLMENGVVKYVNQGGFL